MVCKDTLKCPEHGWLFTTEVKDDKCIHCKADVIKGRTEKMSKSKKNVIDPNDLIKRYGADTIRLFSLFAAPPEKDLEWSDQGVEGASRFLSRLWHLVSSNEDTLKKTDIKGFIGKSKLYKKTHQSIMKVTESIERDYHFNTAIASMMELLNVLTGEQHDDKSLKFAVRSMLLLLSPFAPHIAEELWVISGEEEGISRHSFPEFDVLAAKEDEIELVVQINGKVRSKIMVSAGLKDEDIKGIALSDEKVVSVIGNSEIKKVIVVKGKLVNIVITS
jgi:leucyl-tRNA synthetase